MASFQYKMFSKIVSFIPLKYRIDLLYYRRFGRFVNFDNPVSFSEKLQVRKLYDRDENLTIAADKIASKDFVKRIATNLYIPETLWIGTNVDDIVFEELPRDYVFKANHTSQTLRIVRSGNHLKLPIMKKLTNNWLKHDQSASLGEWAYKNIPRRVFIEEFLDFDGQAPDDYKFFVYHGRVHFIQLDSDRFVDHHRNLYDRDWNDLDVDFSHPRKVPSPSRPTFLNEMIEIAEKIGSNFDFIRVDLYFYNNQVTFGELTVYPGAGYEKFPSHKLDIDFGKPWVQSY
ncbi:ATP-grasp fold amidoligase family protein [Vibrio sinaloensis]|uniref:ATP-grasp fold amidoligase family protein n=2 Tax=Photobacterium sp. (strain ATCC 43367) TaxID=379097 RepID=UPI002F41A86C